MTVQTNLVAIRHKVIRRVLQNLARGAGVRENFEAQLARFFGLLPCFLLCRYFRLTFRLSAYLGGFSGLLSFLPQSDFRLESDLFFRFFTDFFFSK